MEGIGNYKAIPGRSLPPDGQIQNNIFVPIQTQAFIYHDITGWSQNDPLVEQHTRLKKKVSKEQRKANAANQLAKLQKEFDEIKTTFKRSLWLDSHPNVISKGNKLQYK